MHLQRFLKKNPLLIVGSGLSVSMGLPGMWELLNHLKDKIPLNCSTKEKEEWHECLILIEEHGFEEGLGKVSVSSGLLSKIVNETASLVGRRNDEFSESLIDLQISDFPFAKLLLHLTNSLHPLNPILHIVTPNYDHLIEHSCDMININCISGFYGSHHLKFNATKLKDDLYRCETIYEKGRPRKDFRKVPTIKLLKPHGSLNWHKIGETTYQSYKSFPGSTRVIITPGDSKYKASLTDTVMNYHREMANDCINNAESILVIGYGFNDTHLQTVLYDKIKSGIECLIITKSLSAEAKKLIRDFNHVTAIEENGQVGTQWYSQGEQGIWGEPLWDLSHFVNKVIG